MPASTSSPEPRPTESAHVDADVLERRVAAAVRSWLDSFKAALLARFDEAYALQLFDKYAQAFPAAYTEDFAGDAAALDVSFLEAIDKEPARLHLDIYRPDPKRKEKFFLKIFRGQDAIPISDLLPMLENMGLKVIAERPYQLEFSAGRRGWIQDLELVMQSPPAVAFDALDREIKSAFTAVWTGRMDNDSFNQLTLSAGIPWRMVTVLRAYCRYLLQTGLPFSQGYIAQVLGNNASISRLLSELFSARLDPQLSAAARSRCPRAAGPGHTVRAGGSHAFGRGSNPAGPVECALRHGADQRLPTLSVGAAQGISVFQDREPAAA